MVRFSSENGRELIANLMSLLEVHGHDCWFQQLGGYDAWSKLDSTNFARILLRSHSFSKRLAYSISDLISADCSLRGEGGVEIECVQKRPHTLQELRQNTFQA